jgi:hypothetical protein
MGSWWVSIPGDVPDFSKHEHFTDALAKVFFELEEGDMANLKDALEILRLFTDANKRK